MSALPTRVAARAPGERRPGRRTLANTVMLGLCACCAVLALIPLFVVLAYVVAQGASHLSLGLVTTTANGGGGLLNALSGPPLLIVLACGVGLPIGVLGGIYLAECGRGRLATAVRFTSDVMAGLHSIVAGPVALALLVPLTHGFSALS